MQSTVGTLENVPLPTFDLNALLIFCRSKPGTALHMQYGALDYESHETRLTVKELKDL